MLKVGRGLYVRAAAILGGGGGDGGDDVAPTTPLPLEERELVRHGVTHRLLAVARRRSSSAVVVDTASSLSVLDPTSLENLGLKSKRVEVRLKATRKTKSKVLEDGEAEAKADNNGAEKPAQKKVRKVWTEECRDFVRKAVVKSNGAVLIEGESVAVIGAVLACLLLIPELRRPVSTSVASSEDDSLSKKERKKLAKKEKKEKKEQEKKEKKEKKKKNRSRILRKGGDTIRATSSSTDLISYDAVLQLFSRRCGFTPATLPRGVVQALQAHAAQPTESNGTEDHKKTSEHDSAQPPSGEQEQQPFLEPTGDDREPPVLPTEKLDQLDGLSVPIGSRPRSMCISGLVAPAPPVRKSAELPIHEEPGGTSSGASASNAAPQSLNTSTTNAGSLETLPHPAQLRDLSQEMHTPLRSSTDVLVATPPQSPATERQRRNVDPVQAGIKEPLAYVRRNNRGPNDKPDPSDKIYKLGDLPRELRSHVLGTKIPFEDLEKHFDIVLNILYFNKRVEIPKRRRVDRNYKAEPDPQEGVVIEGPRYTAKAEAELLNASLNPKKAFKFVCMTGQGGYGKVWTAKADIPEIKGKVAVKRLPHTDPKEIKHNINEISFLEFCKHPNIVHYYTSCMLKDELLIVMEHMEGGTLTEATKGHNFTELQIAFVARELLKGLAYLHDNRLAHRDLKSANIMMTIKGEIKLIDFGLCVDVSAGPRNDMVGSPFWMAPEMVGRRPHSTPVDIWSFAISLLELANKDPPHRKSSFKCMFTFGTVGCPDPLNDPNKWSWNFKDFLAQCLQVDPAQRATARQLLQHPFVLKTAAQKQMAQLINQIFMQTAISQVVIS